MSGCAVKETSRKRSPESADDPTDVSSKLACEADLLDKREQLLLDGKQMPVLWNTSDYDFLDR